MAKKGRKRTNDVYFGSEQEDAVKQYLLSDDSDERNRIYNEYLREPLNKMVESIIRRYKLYRKGIEFNELHNDALSYLIIKAHKFDGSRDKRAYSYYGTIIKHYLLGKLIDDDKQIKKSVSFEDSVPELETQDEYQYEIDTDAELNVDMFIKNISIDIERELDDDAKATKKRLNENERKVGVALIDILKNWEAIFNITDNGNKYNKISVLETMREYTGLNTKDIRLSMKRYKRLYTLLKMQDIDENQ